MLLAGFVVMECFHWVFVTYMVVPESDMDFLQRRLKMILAIDIAFLIVIYAFMTSFRTFRYLQKKNLELLQWQREYAQSQFETAKNQLNPHFLFNSLHALSSLVWIDADKAERFIEKLSRSYRYLLEGRGRELVPLKEELQFHSNLQYLLQERFGDKLQFRQQQPMDSAGMLPPHSMMIVMDYLLANNSMSHAQPLVVEIKNISQHLEIHYSRRPKENSNPQTIEQLQRLQEQYAAQGKPMQIQNINEKALIRLPIF